MSIRTVWEKAPESLLDLLRAASSFDGDAYNRDLHASIKVQKSEKSGVSLFKKSKTPYEVYKEVVTAPTKEGETLESLQHRSIALVEMIKISFSEIVDLKNRESEIDVNDKVQRVENLVKRLEKFEAIFDLLAVASALDRSIESEFPGTGNPEERQKIYDHYKEILDRPPEGLLYDTMKKMVEDYNTLLGTTLKYEAAEMSKAEKAVDVVTSAFGAAFASAVVIGSAAKLGAAGKVLQAAFDLPVFAARSSGKMAAAAAPAKKGAKPRAIDQLSGETRSWLNGWGKCWKAKEYPNPGKAVLGEAREKYNEELGKAIRLISGPAPKKELEPQSPRDNTPDSNKPAANRPGRF